MGFARWRFPAISCGAFGFPLERAAEISLAVANEPTWDLDEVRFVLFSREVYRAWERAMPPSA